MSKKYLLALIVCMMCAGCAKNINKFSVRELENQGFTDVHLTVKSLQICSRFTALSSDKAKQQGTICDNLSVNSFKITLDKGAK